MPPRMNFCSQFHTWLDRCGQKLISFHWTFPGKDARPRSMLIVPRLALTSQSKWAKFVYRYHIVGGREDSCWFCECFRSENNCVCVCVFRVRTCCSRNASIPSSPSKRERERIYPRWGKKQGLVAGRFQLKGFTILCSYIIFWLEFGSLDFAHNN